MRARLAFAVVVAMVGSCGDDGIHHLADAPPGGDVPQVDAIKADPTSVDFGSVPVTTTSAPSTVTVTNTGATTIASGTIAVTGDGFAMGTSTCTGALAPAATCTFAVTFAPTSTGAKTGAANLAFGGATATVALMGNGVPNDNFVTLAPSTHDFGDVAVGATSAATTFTVAFVGTASSDPLVLALSSAELVLTADTCTGKVLAGGASCTFAIAFQPAVAGARTGSITVTGPGTASANVTANGTAPARLLIQPNVLEFGAPLLGATSPAQTISIINIGEVAVSTISLALQGADLASFSIESNACTTLAPHARCAATIAFSPVTAGAKHASITAAASGVAYTGILGGTGVAPGGLTIAPVSHAYGPLALGMTASQSYAITNTAAAATGPLRAVLDGTTPGQFALGADACSGAPLAAGGSCTVAVAFAPSLNEPAQGTLVVGDGALQVSAGLAGLGQGPALLVISPAATDFGSVLTGTTSPAQTLVIRNLGGTDAPMPALSIGGPDPGNFAVASNTCNAAIPPFASCTAQVTFAPATIGAKSATLVAGTSSAALTGTGIAAGGIAISPATGAFATTAIGDTSDVRVFTITNHNTTATGALTATFAGANSSDFVQTSTCTTLDAGASCTISVAFAPTAIGARATTLSVAGGTGAATAGLSGIARRRLEIVALNSGAPVDPYDFGGRAIGLASADVVIAIRNNTSAAQPLALTEDYAGQYATFDNTCGAMIATNSPCTVRVRFAPTSLGVHTGSLMFAIGATANDQTTQRFTGTGSPQTNNPPTDIALAPASVQENKPSGTLVGNLTATDPDASEAFTYALVGGTGSTDNAKFSIVGATLVTAATFDFEAVTSYSVRIRVSDHAGATFEKPFAIAITNVDEPPSALVLTGSSIPENQPAGTAIGTLAAMDPDAGDVLTYTLPAGQLDNASFSITGSTLASAAMFDFETKNSYQVRVRATDGGGLFTEATFTITVTDVAESPNDIVLAPNAIPENSPVNTVVGTLATTTTQVGVTFTYSLVAGTGSDDNASFNISGATLRASASFNFEAKSSYAIRVRSTDSNLMSIEKALTVNVTDVNEAPTVATTASTLSYTENGPALAIDGAVSVVDPDAAQTLAGATVQIVTGCHPGEDVLAASPPSGIAASYDASTCKLTFSGTSMIALYVSALRSATYRDSSESPLTDPRTVRFTANDGALSGAADRMLAVIAVDDAPVVTTSAPPVRTFTEAGGTPIAIATITEASTTATATTSTAHGLAVGDRVTIAGAGVAGYDAVWSVATAPTSTTFTFVATSGLGTSSGGTATPFAVAIDPAIAVADVDNPTLASATIAITTGCTSAEDVLDVQLGADTGAIAKASTACTLTLTGPATTASFLAALARTTYRNSNVDNPSAQARTVTFTVNDGTLPGTATRQVTVVAVNDKPVLAAPATLAATEDTTATIAGISVADVDAGTSAVTVQLAASHGVLTLSSLAGITVSAGTNGSKAFTASGTLAALNTALANLSYKPDADYNGSDAIALTANDGGATGTGGALSDSKSIAVTVAAVNDAPTIATIGTQTFDEDTTFSFAGLISLADVDAGSGAMKVTLTTTAGTLKLGSTAGLTAVTDNAMAITATGTLAQLNAALVGTTLVPIADSNGAKTVTIAVTDNGNTGSGGALTAMSTVNLAINAIDDAPVIATFPNVGPVTADGSTMTVTSWGTGVGPGGGADEAGQVVTFVIDSITGTGVTAVSITRNGTTANLGFTTNQAAPGVATVSFHVHDDGGANSAVKSFTITTQAAPPVAAADSYAAVGNVGLDVNVAASGVLANDTVNGATVTAFDAASTKGGKVVVNANGTFTYDPPAGVTGTTDTFTYTLTNGGGNAKGTVTITLANIVYFIDATCSAACDGRINHPFTQPSSFTAANAFAYLATGTYTSGLSLATGSSAVGQGATATLAALTGITPPAFSRPFPATGGTRPTVPSVTLTGGGTRIIRGFNLSAGTSTALSGSAFGTLTASEMAATGAVNLATGALSGGFDTLTSTGGVTTNLLLSGISGTFSFGGGALSGATTSAASISSSSAVLSYAGTVTHGSKPVFLSGDSGTITFSGFVSGGQIDLETNTNGHLAFTGGMNLSPGSGIEAFVAQGAGAVSVSGGNNNISTKGSAAVDMNSVDIDPNGVTFNSLTVAGAPSAIMLKTIGGTGSFNVTGKGSTTQGGDDSGGILSASTGDTIVLSAVSNVNLNNVHVIGGSAGVNGTGVINFAFTNGTIENTGGTPIRFDSGAENLDGTLTLVNNLMTNAANDMVSIKAQLGQLTLDVENNLFDGINAKGWALDVIGNGTAKAFTLANGLIAGNEARNFIAGGVNISNTASGSTDGYIGGKIGTSQQLVIKSNYLHALGQAIQIRASAPSTPAVQMNVVIDSNGTAGKPLVTSGAVITVTAIGNVGEQSQITNNFTATSGNDITVNTDAAASTFAPQIFTTITGNNISKTNAPNQAILVSTLDNTGAVNATVSNNTVTFGGAKFGVVVTNGGGAVQGENSTLCLDAVANKVGSITLNKKTTDGTPDPFGVVGTSGNAGTVKTYLDGKNAPTVATVNGSTYVVCTIKTP